MRDGGLPPALKEGREEEKKEKKRGGEYHVIMTIRKFDIFIPPIVNLRSSYCTIHA